MNHTDLHLSDAPGPIGVFDSGYGGLTVLRDIKRALPQYDYLYLGDNARAPYGTRSFELVYRFTLDAVRELMARGCHLVILACNTASAKALRSIQQRDLPLIDPRRRVLGVIRPTVEAVGALSRTGHVGVFATPGTVSSGSYAIEIAHHCPDFQTFQQACPLWAPLVECGEARSDGADFFIRQEADRLLSQSDRIDTIVLGCTHYPLLYDKIRRAVPADVNLVCQGDIVARSLADYLRRHPEIEQKITRGATTRYLTTDSAERFGELGAMFMGEKVEATAISL